MTQRFRLILAACAAFVALAGAPAQGQSSRAIVTFNDPNCASWGVTQSGSNFTLTCQTLLCTLVADKPAPLPTDAVVLTASCAGFTGSTYTWSKFSGPATCPAIASTTATASLAAPGGSGVSGCIYKVAATDAVNGAGSANITLNWSTALGASPSGCSVAFTVGSANMPSAGGPISMIAGCSANTNGATAWSWTKNGAAFGSGTTTSDLLAQNTGVSNVTTTYVVTATNAGSPATPTTQIVTVPGTGGGGGIDMTACAAAGFTGRGLVMNYHVTGNERVYTSTIGNFGNTDAIVVKFTTPAADVTPAQFQLNYAGGTPQVNRVATLDTKPCSFGTHYSLLSLPAATTGQAPIFTVAVPPTVGGGGTGYVQLQGGTDYYITFINRNDFYGQPGSTPSCTASTCDAYIDSR